jgi:hypothetical protein
MLMFVAFAIVGCVSTGSTAGTFKASNSYIVVDINPSVEIVTDDNGLVVRVTALNEDAKVLLVDVDLTGKTLDEAVDTLMNLAKELGYIGLEEENAILFSVETDDQRTAQELIDFLKSKVERFKGKHQLRINCLIEQLSKDPALIEEAETLDISVNKLALIKTAMEYDTTLTVEAGKDMSVKALLKIIIDARKAADGIEDEEDLKTFFENHKRIGAELLAKHIELVNAALQQATDEAFAEVLAGTSATAQNVKDLYQEYLNKVLEVIANYENGTTTPTAGTTDPEENPSVDEEVLKGIIDDLRTQLEDLGAQREKLFADFLALDVTAPDYEEKKAQFKTDLETLRANTEKVMTDLAKAIQDYSGFMFEHRDDHMFGRHFGFGMNYGFGMNWGYGFGRWYGEMHDENNDLLDAIRDVTEEYEAKFEQLGLTLHDVEGLFNDMVRDQFEAYKASIEETFAQFKDTLRARTEEVRDSFRDQKESLKRIYR